MCEYVYSVGIQYCAKGLGILRKVVICYRVSRGNLVFRFKNIILENSKISFSILYVSFCTIHAIWEASWLYSIV